MEVWEVRGGPLLLFLFGIGNLLLVVDVLVKLVVLEVLEMLFFVGGLFVGEKPVLGIPLIMLIWIDA